MRFQCKIGTSEAFGVAVIERPALLPAPPFAPRRTDSAPKRRNSMLNGSLIGSALIAAAGCASTDPNAAKAWKVEPVLNVKHSVQFSQAYYTMGRNHDAARDWGRSIDSYRKAIAADSRNVEAHNALGVVLSQVGRHDAAEAQLRQALAIDPTLAHVRSNLGYVLMLAGKPHDAVVELKAAVLQDGHDTMAMANLREALARVDAVQYRKPDAAHLEAQPVQAVTAAVSHKPAGIERAAVTGPIDVAPGTNLPTTVSVPAPITVAVIPPPLPTSITVPMPLQTASVPAPLVVVAEAVPASPVVRAPIAMRVFDTPTVASLQEQAKPVTTAAAQPQVQPQVQPELQVLGQAPSVDLPSTTVAASFVKASPMRLEVSNGNGVTGMAARVGRWLGTQGMQAHRLTNQQPYAQQFTVVQYRIGYEEAAMRVAQSLPANARADAGPTTGLRSDVRVVLGRDWIQTAACLEKDACLAPQTSVAAMVPGR